MITAVTIGGQPVDLGQVMADEVTVLHGRGAVDDGPTASSATLRLLIASGMPSWAVGDTLSIDTADGPLFTGVVADRRISRHVDTTERGRVAVFELTAAGAVAKPLPAKVAHQPALTAANSNYFTRPFSL